MLVPVVVVEGMLCRCLLGDGILSWGESSPELLVRGLGVGIGTACLLEELGTYVTVARGVLVKVVLVVLLGIVEVREGLHLDLEWSCILAL